MSDPVNHPAHYTEHPSGIECIQITEHMGFNLGNAVKYIWRADLKGSAIEDLEKARWYVDRELVKRGEATEPAECEFRCEEAIARAGVGVRCPACTAAIRDKEAIEPAEEETNAEGPCEVRSPQGDTCSFPKPGHAGVHTWVWPDKKPASSPVVPAPTETEWQTWQEVPEGVWFLTNQNIGCWMRRDGDKVTTVTGGWPVCTDSLVAQTPFVAAEEG